MKKTKVTARTNRTAQTKPGGASGPKPRGGTVVVTGDVTMDWNIAHTQREKIDSLPWNDADRTRACWQRGGAALVADLVREAAKGVIAADGGPIRVHAVKAPVDGIRPADSCFHHSYALWEEFDRRQDKDGAWRVKRFLGLCRCEGDPAKSGPAWGRVENDPARADIVVLDDANLGFRERRELWPASLSNGSKPDWIVLKMSQPVIEGGLWAHLLEKHADRLIVVMTLADLRRAAVRISGQISWEQTAEDLVRELRRNPLVNVVDQCAVAVISLDTVGVMALTGSGYGYTNTLFYDPEHMEGEWGPRAGRMIGNTSVLTAAIVRELLLNPDQPEIGRGIQAGVAGMRRLCLAGYDDEEKEAEEKQEKHGVDEERPPRLSFPVRKVVAEIEVIGGQEADSGPLMKIGVPLAAKIAGPAETDEAPPPRLWSILDQGVSGNALIIATNIVRDGLGESLPGAPRGRFRDLVTVDRREIEALRSIKGLIEEYCARPQPRPLSIAVFGPPGAGKSFAIKEVAKAVKPDLIDSLTFNLSQFDGPADLLGAFHQVRDLCLGGKIPLVFWDEFDTDLEGRSLGWLRYFLAPMQDGEFQEGQVTHPVGRSIFVFAGGTKKTMNEFAGDLTNDDETKKDKAKAAKVPDFVSRLKGNLDVLGPDPQPIRGLGDDYSVIRRAILLRSMFKRTAKHLFHGDALRIDSGVLRALLEVRQYRHGARSIESIIAMSRLSDSISFERSCLPPQPQLELHVNGREFMARVQQLVLEGELLERLAEALHNSFCADLRRRGYTYGPQTNDRRKKHSSLLSYKDKEGNEEKEIPAHEREQNRDAVRDIPHKLARYGYIMVPARPGEPEFKFPPKVVEKMAKDEHDRWMRMKVADGWKWAKVTDKPRKKHNLLVDWSNLPPAEKAKDRRIVQNIPKLLRDVHYTVREVDELNSRQ